MALIVQKFGGTSVGSIERIRNVAWRVAKWQAAGHRIVVVPSAMSGETNRLLSLAAGVQAHPDPRELDVVASTGEQVTRRPAGDGAARARRQGAQLHRLAGEGADRLRLHPGAHHLDRRGATCARTWRTAASPWSPASRASTRNGNITTLGRGGSDTSAVALAAALGADECQIYTDVDGVYTTDPRIVPEARRLHTITFEEMLEMASAGSKVLQIRSVEFAGKYKVPTRVLSSLTDPKMPVEQEARSGTLITFEEDPHMAMEKAVVSGVALSATRPRSPSSACPTSRASPTRSSGPIADAGINVDVIVQNVSHDGTTDLSFTAQPRRPARKAMKMLKRPGQAAHQVPGRHRRRPHGQGVDRRPGHALARRHRGARCSAPWPRRASTSR